MNNDTNNKYIHSDNDYNNHNIEENEKEEDDENNTNLKHNSQAWGTWEELLLACAVKRHGFTNWDSVATEVRSRSSNSVVSANNCKQKYRDLKRRFHESHNTDATTETTVEEEEERIGNNIPWLEQLRSLRVAELRREVQRYDDSILSLQMKVKKLEEEKEGDEKPDLEDNRKLERSESDHREKTVSATAEEESDRENRSMNESNSTASGGKTAGNEPSRDESGGNNPDPDPVSRGSEASESDELGESGTSWKKNNHGGSGEEIRSAMSKSQPLISLLDLIRSHPRGSLFERRLRSQETKEYKSLVKQHLDIEVIQRKLKKGSYDSSSLCFYRDLQLLFTNAIVFFPLSSSESMAAHELRTVVSKEMRKETGKSSPRLINREALVLDSVKADAETSDSSLSRQKSLAPLVACKKRKIVSAKASPSSSSFSEKEETKEEVLSEEKEDNMTGARSSRRTNKVVADAATKTGKGKNKQKQAESKTSNDNSSKQETGKTDKKVVSSDKKKSVADFLKRLKKNSPQKEGKDQNKNGGSSKKESKTKPRELRSSSVGKKKAEVENTPAKRGRPQKKTAEAAAMATASGKRGRESGSTGKDNNKQPKKRSRR
ncbi:hypothetical protein AALP_AA4G233200 [Arabis alpina]|uniref:Uncharacterized protein n=1 Tax=Arabis alpina TaxID=50452 RepID=A0A087H546_ARAAL|nr:hypothetical protein AALP_AA4G233200 [Arabis alpina]